MKFALVGGLGYIGQILQEELKRKGHEFEIIDNDLMNLHDHPKKLSVVDFDDLSEISKIIQGSDIIVNLAAIVGDQGCLVDTRMSIEINCQGVQNITKICNKYNKKIIHLSTCSLYGASDNILTEESPTFPVDFYGQTKYQQERYILESGNDYCVFRLGTIYGWSPRMRFDLVINTFAAKAHAGEKLTVFGGDQWRPFVHVKDVGRAIIYAAEKNLKGVYNLCNENKKIKDIALEIGQDKVPVELNELQADPRNYRAVSEKLQNEGFSFEWNVQKGVEEMFQNSEDLKRYTKPQYSNYKMMVLKKLG